MHPDFDSPEHHEPRRFARRDAMTLDRILALNAIEVARARALTAASPAAVPSDRPANAAGGCDDLSAQTPGPAGVEASTMDLFGRMGAR